jgi:hypothetical protein
MAAPRQIIYTHGGGRLGNQLLRFAHWIAWALEQDDEVEVRDLAFWPYARFFDVWRRHPGCVFPPRADRWDELARWRQLLPEYVTHRLDWRVQRAVQAAGGRLPGWQELTLDIAARESIDLETPALRQRLARADVTTCSGWRIHGWNLVAKHAAALRGYFQPERAVRARAEEYIADLRRRHGYLIGLFVRQEDYRQWIDGRYYFDHAQYARWVEQALALHPGRQPAVLLAAAEWTGPATYGRLPVYPSTGNPGQGGHWFEQWVQLSLCDVVLSVPSTFAATAAFCGDRPLWPLLRPDQVLATDQIIGEGMLGAVRHPDFSIAVN